MSPGAGLAEEFDYKAPRDERRAADLRICPIA
jgi:hypothetical protein